VFYCRQGIALLDKLIWHLETYDIISVRASVPMFCQRQSRNQELKLCFLVKERMKFWRLFVFRNAPSAEEFQKKQLKEYKSYLQQIYFVQINQLCHKG
jgi:asparagine synthase (glutamine-hydrolysing)